MPHAQRPREHQFADTRDLNRESTARLSGLSQLTELLSSPHQADPLLGTTLGNITLVRLVAEGGMGRVYEGLQERPRRTVAVKVIRSGVVSPRLLKRFEYEAQILGRLTHPGIAQIHAVESERVADTVVPYFVMEFIHDARSLTAYASETDLSTHDRVALFQQVCEAVAYGHHKGIIHRDLKPSNILVDAAGQPKVIDFGVARSTDADVALTTMHTDIGQLIGTLQYMCPEQFAADPDDIDVRADVYALGVVLYELLAGRPPYELRKKTVLEAARVVREVDPTPISSWNRTLRRDIATIASKCLEKDREKRYSSAGEIAADLGRYLAGEPITATPPRFIDAVARLARRHRAAAIAVTAVLATLLLAMVGISFFALRAEAARRNALLERKRAEANAATAATAEARANSEMLAAKKQLYRASVRASDSSIFESNSPASMHARQQVENLLQFASDSDPAGLPFEVRCLDAAWNSTLATLQTDTRHSDRVGFSIEEDHIVLPPHVWQWPAERLSPARGRLCASSRCRLGAISRSRGVMACVPARGICEIVNLDTLQTEAVLDACPGSIIDITFNLTGSHLAAVVNHRVGPSGPQQPRSADRLRGQTSIVIWETRSWRQAASVPCRQTIRPAAWAISPSGDAVALGSGPTAEIRFLARPDEVITVGGHTGPVTSVAFSPDGTRLATGSVNTNWTGTVKIWAPATGDCLGTLQANPGRSAHTARLVFSPDGDRIAITFGDRHAHLWDGVSRESKLLVGHGGRVFAAHFFPDGNRVATCSADFTVRTWNVATGQPLSVFMGLRDEVTRLAITADGRHIAACDLAGAVGVWCADPDRQPAVLHTPDGTQVTQLQVRPDGSQVAASCLDGIVRIWDACSGVLLAELPRPAGPGRAGWAYLSYSADGSLLAATAADGLTAVWDAWTGRLLHAFPNPGEFGRCVTFSPDGRLLATGFLTGKALVWELPTGRKVATVTAVQNDIGCCRIAFGLAGKRLATGSVTLWNPLTGQAVGRFVGEGLVTSLASSPDGRRFASTTTSGAATVWDAATGDRVCRLLPHFEGSRVVDFSPDGSLVATGGFDMITRISNATTGQLVHALKGHTGWVQCLTFSPDGHRVVTGGWDHTARIWDTTSGEPLVVLRGHDDYVKRLAFSPDGTRMYSCSFDGTVRIWGRTNRSLRLDRRRFHQRASEFSELVDDWLQAKFTRLPEQLESARRVLDPEDFRIASSLLLLKAATHARPVTAAAVDSFRE